MLEIELQLHVELEFRRLPAARLSLDCDPPEELLQRQNASISTSNAGGVASGAILAAGAASFRTWT